MATVYVSPTGSDAYTYAQAQNPATPWLTIGKCQTSATTGDTIVCASGTHTWASVTFTKNFTIQATLTPVYNALTRTWSGTVFNGAAATVLWTGGATVTIVLTDLVFTNAACSTTSALFQDFLTANVTRCVFYGCILNASNPSRRFGGIAKSSNVVGTWTFTSCQSYGHTHVYAGTTLFSCDAALTRWNFYNCSFADCQIIVGEQNYAYVVMRNCVCTGGGYYSWLGNTGMSLTVSYSCGYNFSGTNNMFIPASGPGNIQTNPLFIDPVYGNLGLQAGSPCRDTAGPA